MCIRDRDNGARALVVTPKDIDAIIRRAANLLFRLFPGFFAEGGILRQIIEVICQRTFLFLLCTHQMCIRDRVHTATVKYRFPSFSSPLPRQMARAVAPPLPIIDVYKRQS